MANKIITLDSHFPTGEPTVQLVATWGRNDRILREATSLQKTAAHSPAEDYIRSITPEPGKSIVLVIGLGDHETYGANRNGDGFPSEPIKGKITSDEVLPKHFKSYEKAHVFEHHVNHDPAKAIGRVKKAFWNGHMRRVEVVEDFDHAKAPQLLERIAAGEYPAKSMGCRIKYDVCTKCGNRARTRAEYCDHLRYAMNQIDPNTGIQNAALNPSPDFFDSSWVIRPADRTGYMLKKVADERPYEVRMGSFELSDIISDLSEKAAALRKAADIEKVIQGEPIATASSLTESDAKLVKKYHDTKQDQPKDHDKVVKIMITYKPSEAIGTAEDMDIPLGIKELIKYFMGRMAPDDADSVSESVCKSASDHVGLLLETFAAYPRFFDETIKLASVEGLKVNNELKNKVASIDAAVEMLPVAYDYATDFKPQNITEDYAYRQRTPAVLRKYERPLTDLVHYTDPNTGQRYVTNYGAVQRAHDTLARGASARRSALLGASALLAAATLGMGLSKRTSENPIRLITGLGSAALGGLGLVMPDSYAGPKIQTDEGETISGWTEMVPRTYDIAPEIAYLNKRASDDAPRALSATIREQYFGSIKEAEVHDELDVYAGCTLDFEKVADAVGRSILLLTA
jgi:hypothetical protein